MYKKFAIREDDMISQASYPTIDIDASYNSIEKLRRREGYHSDSDFGSLEPVFEEQESVDENDVLLNVSATKFEKPKD